MQSGTIENLISYYTGSDKFQEEIERAKKEFFDSHADKIILMLDEKYKPYFIEWLVFDFRLKNGKGLLEDYYYRNPRKRPLYEMQVYKDLQDNIYGMVEVQKVYIGEGLDLLMIHTNEKYYVREHSATFSLEKSNVFFTRIANIDKQYKLAGANFFALPIRLDSKSKKHLIDKDRKFTPKDMIGLLKDSDQPAPSPEVEDIDKIKVDFDKLLDDLKIGGMISVDLVQKWLANINFKRAGTPIVDILIGLADHWPDKNQMDRLLSLTVALANNSPQKALGGKSPQELTKGHEHEFGFKGINTSVRQIGGEWSDYANKAIKYLKEMEVSMALDYFEKTFTILLQEKTTGRYIFSIFANMGVCYMYFGMEYMARKLLSIAIELNPDYKFGKKALAEMDGKKGDEQLSIAIRLSLAGVQTKEIKEFWKTVKKYSDAELRRAYHEFLLPDYEIEWKNNPAKKYYDFLKTLEINFKGVS